MPDDSIDPVEILSTADSALLRSALRKGATRREVMGWLMAGGVGIATAGSIVTYATQALAETPKKGGRLRVAGSGTSTADTVDPAKQSFSTDYARGNMFYNGLTSLDGKLAPQLALAESIENDKATVWTIKLRKDVAFHDGKKLTAADVVYSLNRHKDPTVGSKAKSLAEHSPSIIVSDQSTRSARRNHSLAVARFRTEFLYPKI
jgi:peptide/nickel transport system substrate-binding protein